MSSSNMNIAQEINELSLNTDNTAQQYACYLKKFAVFVGQTGVLTAGIYADKSFFTDENIGGFLLKYFNEKDSRPHFKKVILAAIGSGLLFYGLPGIFSSFGVYPLTMKMKKVIYSSIHFFNNIY